MLAALLLASCARHETRGPASQAPATARPAAAAAGDTRALRTALLAGVRAYRLRHFVAARDLFGRALALEPGNVDARYDRARANEALHRWPAVADDLRLVAAARPAWTNARLQLAVARFRLHDYPRAAGDFDRVLRRDAKTSAVWLDAGVSYYRAGDWRRSADRLHQAVALAPRSGRARYWLGMAYRKLGKASLARREFLLAVRSRDRAVRRSARAALAAR